MEHCINCLTELNVLDEDPNGEKNVSCAKCLAEEAHDFDAEPDVRFGRDGRMVASGKFGFQTGYFQNIDVGITMSGPQNGDQVPDQVKQIFRESKLPVKYVMIVYEGVTGHEKIDCYNEIE